MLRIVAGTNIYCCYFKYLTDKHYYYWIYSISKAFAGGAKGLNQVKFCMVAI